MAEASIQFLLENLTTLIKGEIGLILGVNSEINKLSSNLTIIQAVLQDAEDKQLENESIRVWLRKLNNLSFEIEDVLDECVTELGRLEYQNRRSKCIKKILYKWKIARRIKQVIAELDVVVAEREKFHLSETTHVVLQHQVPAMRETGSVLNVADLVLGRDEEREEIVDILINKVRDVHELSVLPIIGLGGLGKTTLTRLVFNDKRVTEHFDIKLWVCVSDNFDQKTLIKAMLASATQSESVSSLDQLDALQRKLFQLLHQKRYLLVLDDVWNDNQEKWLELKNQLACGKTGSSIIVTTRLEMVAKIMATTPAHNLKGLSDESCWLLFKERAFGHEEGESKILEDIGWDIVKKCAGVPLAATTLGGLLRFERREDDWIRVKESPIWRLPQNESSILPALRLSYNHLSLTHRHCFAYCAVFPKDSDIEKEELIRQWMAHGYISSDGTSDVEEIADKIFNELVLRSLLLNVRTFVGGVILFQMHDLVHDLAQSIMENKVPRPQAELDSVPMLSSTVRDVNFDRRYAAFPWRSLPGMDLFTVFLTFHRLRSLDASRSDVRCVPPEIGKLKQLRYLNLSWNEELEILPEKLCSLWNLKILDLSGCSRFKSLPKGMSMLRNLRHLFLEGCDSLGQMPPNIGELTSLKTMRIFIVGKERDNQIRELRPLELLGGKLVITNLEKVQEKQLDVSKPILAEKRNLRDVELRWERRRLGLRWGRDDSFSCKESVDEKVLKVLDPHANVKILKIVGFRGNHIPLWMTSSTLQIKLVELRIEECKNCLRLPHVVVELPHLKKLKLCHLPALEYIVENDEVGVKFPVLEELHLYSLENMKGLLKKETGEFFPNLRNLEIRRCSSLLSLPQVSSLGTLEVRECDSLLSLPQLSSLGTLEVSSCCSLLSLPQLSSLVDLKCSNMHVTSVGGKFDNLSSLNMYCEEVDVGVPKECLTNNLKSLKIWGPAIDEDSLPEEGIQALKSLEELSISGGRLRSLPGRWLSHLTSLESLRLHACSELVEIAEEIKYLQNLKQLRLGSLPKVVSIPSTIQQLPKLQILDIFNCPELKKRCEKEVGDDWHKIAHIPFNIIM